MKEYICGPVVNAANKEAAIAEVTPLYNFAIKAAQAETIVCVPRASVGIPLVVGLFLTTMVLFSILGVIASKANATKIERK